MQLRAEEEEGKVQTSGRDRQTRPTIRQNVILPWQIIAYGAGARAWSNCRSRSRVQL